MRDAVSTWTIASTAAAVANQALNAIGDENTVVTMSRYVLVASSSGPIASFARVWPGAYAAEGGLEPTPSPGRVSEGYPVDPDTKRVGPAAASPRPARSFPPIWERGASA